MPTRRLALIQTDKGPWVSTRGVQLPEALVTGLQPDSTLYIHVIAKTGHLTFCIRSNGRHRLESADWMRVTCAGGKADTVICEIVSARAA